jgi:hypothetical protein
LANTTLQDNGKRKCNVCKANGVHKEYVDTQYNETMYEHLRHHTHYRLLYCSFPGCVFAHSKESTVETHSFTHTNKKRHACLWLGCPLTFANIHDRGHHIKDDHPEWSAAGLQSEAEVQRQQRQRLAEHLEEIKQKQAKAEAAHRELNLKYTPVSPEIKQSAQECIRERRRAFWKRGREGGGEGEMMKFDQKWFSDLRFPGSPFFVKRCGENGEWMQVTLNYERLEAYVIKRDSGYCHTLECIIESNQLDRYMHVKTLHRSELFPSLALVIDSKLTVHNGFALKLFAAVNCHAVMMESPEIVAACEKGIRNGEITAEGIEKLGKDLHVNVVKHTLLIYTANFSLCPVAMDPLGNVPVFKFRMDYDMNTHHTGLVGWMQVVIGHLIAGRPVSAQCLAELIAAIINIFGSAAHLQTLLLQGGPCAFSIAIEGTQHRMPNCPFPLHLIENGSSVQSGDVVSFTGQQGHSAGEPCADCDVSALGMCKMHFARCRCTHASHQGVACRVLMGGRAGRCINCVSDCSDQSSRSYPREKRGEAAAYGYGWPGKPILTREQWYEFVGHEAGEGAGGDGARLEVECLVEK